MTEPLAGKPVPNLMTDEEVMLRVQAGQTESFAILVERYQKGAWRLAWRYSMDQQQAQDLVQEAFLRVFRASSSYKPTARFSTWFYRVLVNACLDSRRKRTDESLGEIEPVDPHSEDEARETLRRQRALHIAIDTLPERYRMAVILRHLEGLTLEETAEALETTPKAVERILAKAREKLAKELTGVV